MAPSFIPVLAILASTLSLVNAATYLGCVENSITGSSPASSIQGNVGKCESYCTNDQPRPYFYYLEAEEYCVCSDASPEAGTYVSGESNQGGCASTGDYLAYATTTSFDFQGCYANMITDNAPPDVTKLEDCFSACRTEGSVMILPNPNNDQFGCRCNAATTIEGIDNGGGDDRTCNALTWFTYTHTAEATASGLAKRNLRERLLKLKRESQTLCPSGSKACSVPGSNTYECIDTASELESCGGCMSGEFQSSSNVTVGVDCSSLPGVALGAVTCHNSQCEAFACRKGYELAAGLCVPMA